MDDTVLMYFYGTLRPGEFNYGRFCLSRMADLVAENVEVPGRMYSYHDGYPVVNFNRKGTVRGTLMRVDGAIAAMIHDMERGAGYEALRLEVKIGDTTHYPLTYHWSRSTDGHRRIDSGDWIEYSNTLVYSGRM